jgi:hypothetical protein
MTSPKNVEKNVEENLNQMIEISGIKPCTTFWHTPHFPEKHLAPRLAEQARRPYGQYHH